MRILPAAEEQIRRVVRDVRVKDPLIRVAGLKAVLEKHFRRGFSHQYVSKIADKVAREGLMEADRSQIEERMQFTRENYRMMRAPNARARHEPSSFTWRSQTKMGGRANVDETFNRPRR